MAFDYAGARLDAQSIIDEFGDTGAFVVSGVSGGFDPATGDPLPDTADTQISGTVTPLLQYKLNEIDGTTIKGGDAYVFFHSATAPPIDAKITINSTKWRAVSINELTSVGGVNVYRKIQLRR